MPRKPIPPARLARLAKEKKKKYRTYSPVLARKVLRIIAREDLGLYPLYRKYRHIGFPHEEKFYRWLTNHPDFAMGYVLAKRAQAQRLAMEQVDIPDALLRKKGRLRQEDIQLAKLRAESRRWAAARLAPKEWGDRMEIAGDPDAPLRIESWLDLANLAEERD